MELKRELAIHEANFSKYRSRQKKGRCSSCQSLQGIAFNAFVNCGSYTEKFRLITRDFIRLILSLWAALSIGSSASAEAYTWSSYIAIWSEVDIVPTIGKYEPMHTLFFCASLFAALCTYGAMQVDSTGDYSSFTRSLGAKNNYGYRKVSSPEPVREGKVSERFELHAGDCTATKEWNDCANDRERSELAQRPPYSLPENEYWYFWSLFVPESFKNIFPTKVCLGQFHQEGARSPPLMFQNADGGYWLDLNQTEQKPELLIEDKDLRGRWHDFLVNARWSKGKDGFLKIWVNGNLKFSRDGANLKQDGPVIFKYGIYRSFLSRNKAKRPDQVVYFDAVRWGSKRKDVEIPKP
jgi:hypothetical protein